MKAFAGLSCALLLVIRSLAAFADGGINHQNADGLAEQNAAHSPRSQEQKAFVESRLFSVAGHTFEVPAYFLLNDISDTGVVPGITLDVGYPGGAAVGESQLHLRNGEGIRLVVLDKGVSPKQAMDNVLKYRKNIEVLPQAGSGYVKYRVAGGATVDYYYFEGISVFVSCIVGHDSVSSSLAVNPMCRANFGQVVPDVFVSAVFSESLVFEMSSILKFVRDFLELHIREA